MTAAIRSANSRSRSEATPALLSIKGALYGGIVTTTGSADVTDFGSITRTMTGIFAHTNATVTNNAGASITSSGFGIYADAGGSSVFNAGTISGGTAAIQFAGSGNTLTLAPGSVISGRVSGTGSNVFTPYAAGQFTTFDLPAYVILRLLAR